MRKIRMAADELQVESFTTAGAEPEGGTVLGRMATLHCTAVPRCGTVRQGETCASGCTVEVCTGSLCTADVC